MRKTLIAVAAAGALSVGALGGTAVASSGAGDCNTDGGDHAAMNH